MATCAHRDCNSTEVDEMKIPLDWAYGRKIHAIVNVCEDCKEALAGKPIDYNFWRAGQLHFIEEMWASEKE